ncbi:hypothetical protein [Natronorarus salvus]|uniref:hypothetical protein n=1 Tax=Natronorarus salvus TaxID=3117733 RepID=UPI002F265AB5
MLLNVTTDRPAVRASVFSFPLGLWMMMAVVAISNGVVRETVLIPRVGEYIGHLVSTAILITAILVLSYAYFRKSSINYTQTELLLVGVLWVVLTVGLEFLIGHLEGIPVSETLAQYNVFAGYVWILVPLTLLVAPLLFGSYLAARRDP